MLTTINDEAFGEKIMKLIILKNTIITMMLGFVVLIGTNQVAFSQGNRNDQRKEQQRAEKQRRDSEKQQQKIHKQQAKMEDSRIKADQRREQMRIRNMPRQTQNNDNNRFRVNRNGTYYQTDNRGVELLRQSVNAGYQEGYRAGRDDRNQRRSDNYNNSSVYRNGNYGYQNYVTRNQYQYYFQQGFQRGYQDGFNSRYEYGTNNNGSLNIMGNILQTILNIESY